MKKYYVWDANVRPSNPLIRTEEYSKIALDFPKEGMLSISPYNSDDVFRWKHYEEIKEPELRDMTPREVFEIMAKGAVVIDYECEDFVGTCMKYNINDNNYCTGYGYAELSRFRYSLPTDDFLNTWHEFKVEDK